jgi:CDI immunity protein
LPTRYSHRHSQPNESPTGILVQIISSGPEEQIGAIGSEWPPWSNGKVLTVGARTGFSGWLIPGAREIDLPPDADDATLGAAVNDVLSYGRDWYGQSARRERSREERTAQYRAWRDSLMSRHGYKTQRALYINMLHVTIERGGGRLQCLPSNHVKIDAWDGDGLPANSQVVVAADSSAAAIGAALRLTFSRCLDTFGQKAKPT